MRNIKILVPFLWLLILLLSTFMIQQVNRFEERQIKGLQDNLLQNAISHYDDIVMVRKWSASHGGVYVKQHDGLQPNPYLKDNVAYTDKHEKLIKMNPAWITRQISEISNQNRKHQYKITSLNPINPGNAPNYFETVALKHLQKNRAQRYFYQFDSADKFQFLGALYVENSCLKCHGEQGYHVGDVRGGVRIDLPTDSYRTSKQLIHTQSYNIKNGIILSAILIGILISFWMLSIMRHSQYLIHENDKLENTVNERTTQLAELNRTLEHRVEEEVAKNKANEEMMIFQSRHAAMGEMISMIAHQWRQPVSTLSMIANNMVIDIALGEINPKNLEATADEILSQSVYLSQTIDDFTDFFKPSKTKESFLPSNVLKDALNIIGKSIENNKIDLIIKNHSEHQVRGYPHELMQVYINLLKNAKEAFLTSNDQSKHITIDTYEENDRIITKISDNGRGIKPEIIEKIFSPYFTTKEEFNGTGLGLYMSKIIIENHLMGKIWVESEANNTCFLISLPIYTDVAVNA